MNKKMSSQPATSGAIAILLDAAIRAATSKDPHQRTAGWILIAGCFVAYLVGDTPPPLL